MLFELDNLLLRTFTESNIFILKNEARKMNHQEVAEEDKRNKLPANFAAKQRRVEWEIQEEDAKKV